jgi:hypothetical protein
VTGPVEPVEPAPTVMESVEKVPDGV